MTAMPKLVTIAECDFPMVETEVANYKVLKLPAELRRRFDDGASVVRIDSIETARAIPDYGGKASGDFSLLFHQDHFGNTDDPRRYLVLSKLTDGARGARTLIMTPETVRQTLPLAEAYVTDPARRRLLAREGGYDTRFCISEEQYHLCLNERGGYHRVVREVAGGAASRERELSVRLNILCYLVRGATADSAMQEMLERCRAFIVEERWEKAGVVVIDNARVFHGRLGGNNPPLKRNFCV